MSMNLEGGKPVSDKTGSGSSQTAQDTCIAQVLDPDRVDLADCKLQGWDFRDLAAFVRAEDDDWVQRTGIECGPTATAANHAIATGPIRLLQPE